MGSQPNSKEWNNFVRSFATCFAALYFKYWLCLVLSVDPENHPDEDQGLLAPPPLEDAHRKKRMFANDMENIPIHMAIFAMAFMVQYVLNTQPNKGQNGTRALNNLIIIYTVCRYLYTIFYFFKLQPCRTIAFLLAQLTIFATLIVMIISACEYDYNDYTNY